MTARSFLRQPILHNLVRHRRHHHHKHLRIQCYSTTLPRSNDPITNSSSTTQAFDTNLKILQKDNAARAQQQQQQYLNSCRTEYDYFRTEIAHRLLDRLDDIVREEGFPLALDLGSGPGHLYNSIKEQVDEWEDDEGTVHRVAIGGIQKLVMMDSSPGMLHRDDDKDDDALGAKDSQPIVGNYKLVSQSEDTLPFPDGTFDLVLSSTALHWVNDLPTLLAEIKRILKPDGCFLWAMMGGATLPELRSSLVLAELEREGGVSPHVGPFLDVADVGSLLTQAGFALPTVDVDTVRVGYPNAMVLMEHLQRMGEGNAALSRKAKVSRDTFLSAACLYDSMFPLASQEEGEEEGDVEASVQVIYAIGWSPHASQQQPKERGSAKHKVGDSIVVDKTSNDTTS